MNDMFKRKKKELACTFYLDITKKRVSLMISQTHLNPTEFKTQAA